MKLHLKTILLFVCLSLPFAGCREEFPEFIGSPDISVDDLRFYVQYLSADEMVGRESGTKEGQKAARFIQSHYKKMGLSPAFNGEYLQKFSMKPAFDLKAGQNYLEFEGEKPKKEKLSNSTHYVFVPFPGSKRGEQKLELVYMGFCLKTPDGSRDDFKARDVKDKAVLCLRHGPGGRKNKKYRAYISFEHKYKTAMEKGAAMVIFLGRDGVKDLTAESISSTGVNIKEQSSAVFMSPKALLNKFPHLKKEETALLKGKTSTLIGNTLGDIQVNINYKEIKRFGYNVGAYLRKPKAGEPLIILGAHFDHIGRGLFSGMGKRGEIHNGADDNASGTAALLEAATLLKKKAKEYAPQEANILFLNFDGEERGLLGSRHFVKSKTYNKEQVKLMVNLDMVGRLRGNTGLTVQGTDTTKESLKPGVKSALKNAGFKPNFKINYLKGGYGPSDHTSFYKTGVPVLFIHTGSHSDYHTEKDDHPLVNFQGLAAISRFVIHLVNQKPILTMTAVKTAPGPGDPMGKKMRYRLRLGIIPGDYSQNDGILVGDIRKDSPLAKTEMKAGDRIVAINDKKLDDIHDLMRFLQGAEEDKVYTFKFVRGKEKKSVRAPLMKGE